MAFKKGFDSNRNTKGRPKNPEIELLRNALEAEGKKRKIDFWKQVAHTAYSNTTIMTAIVKKFIPDLTSAEVTQTIKEIKRIVIEYPGGYVPKPNRNRLEVES